MDIMASKYSDFETHVCNAKTLCGCRKYPTMVEDEPIIAELENLPKSDSVYISSHESGPCIVGSARNMKSGEKILKGLQKNWNEWGAGLPSLLDVGRKTLIN